MSRLVDPKDKPNKSFIHIGWFRKKINIPDMPENIMNYFDGSFLKEIPDFSVEFSFENYYHKQVIFTNKSNSKIQKTINISNQKYERFSYDYYIIPSSVSYRDSENRFFSWPINDFKNWPKDVKTFTLKFIEALENAYYRCTEENKVRDEMEANFQKVLKEGELEEVKTFFGELLK